MAYKGDMVVIVLDRLVVEGMEFNEIYQWLMKMTPSGLRKSNSYLLKAGDAVWIPFGSIGLSIGVEPPPEGCSDPQKRKVCFVNREKNAALSIRCLGTSMSGCFYIPTQGVE